jgi:hypothetical protein
MAPRFIASSGSEEEIAQMTMTLLEPLNAPVLVTLPPGA